jgi:hypothetical protein
MMVSRYVVALAMFLPRMWGTVFCLLLISGCASDTAGLRIVEYRVGETLSGVSVHQYGAAHAFAHVHIRYRAERGEIEVVAAPADADGEGDDDDANGEDDGDVPD